MPIQSFRVKGSNKVVRVRRNQTVPKATKQYVKKAIKQAPETKELNSYTANGVSMAYDTPVLQTLSNISQGDANGQREGNRVRLHKLQGRLDINVNNASVARVIIFQWKPQSADDAPTSAKILEYGALTSNSVNYPIVIDKAFHLKMNVLFDKRYTMRDTSTHVLDFINITKFKNQYIYYDETVNNTGKNNLYILALSNTAAAAAEPVLFADLHLYFKDM